MPDALPLVGLEPARREPTAGDLVAAWCRGYTETRGAQPVAAQTARVGRTARSLMADLPGQSWPVALEVAAQAGRRGFLDLVLAWSQNAPGMSLPTSRNAAILARAHGRAEESEGR